MSRFRPRASFVDFKFSKLGSGFGWRHRLARFYLCDILIDDVSIGDLFLFAMLILPRIFYSSEFLFKHLNFNCKKNFLFRDRFGPRRGEKPYKGIWLASVGG